MAMFVSMFVSITLVCLDNGEVVVSITVNGQMFVSITVTVSKSFRLWPDVCLENC